MTITTDIPTTTADLTIESMAYLAIEDVQAAYVLDQDCPLASAELMWAGLELTLQPDVPAGTRVETSDDPAQALAEVRTLLDRGIVESPDLRTTLKFDRARRSVERAQALLAAALAEGVGR